MQQKQKLLGGFTLVELIVVITIVGILSTVGFVSYSGYLTGARDSNRISQMVKLSDSLQVYSASKTLPLPDNYVEVEASGSLIGYQGEVGVDVLETIDYTNGGTDPKDGDYYTYYLTKDRNSMQLMALMEDQQSVAHTTINTSYAADYSNRYPKVYGRKLGILTQVDTNTPIQDIGLFDSAAFDVVTETGYIGNISDDEKVNGGTSGDLSILNPQASCSRIKQTGGAGNSGIYTISPLGTAFDVYCDMEISGGGWTAASMLADSTSENIFHTGNVEYVTSISENVSSKGTITNIWKDNQDKDIMIQCVVNSGSEFDKYNTPFFIYGFKKADIGNLTKDGKSGTSFSSSSLQGSWGNIKYTLGTNYDGADANPSMYIRGTYNGNTGRVFGILITGSNVSRIYQTGTSVVDSPYYSSVVQGLDFDENNYCTVFIK